MSTIYDRLLDKLTMISVANMSQSQIAEVIREISTIIDDESLLSINHTSYNIEYGELVDRSKLENIIQTIKGDIAYLDQTRSNLTITQYTSTLNELNTLLNKLDSAILKYRPELFYDAYNPDVLTYAITTDMLSGESSNAYISGTDGFTNTTIITTPITITYDIQLNVLSSITEKRITSQGRALSSSISGDGASTLIDTSNNIEIYRSDPTSVDILTNSLNINNVTLALIDTFTQNKEYVLTITLTSQDIMSTCSVIISGIVNITADSVPSSNYYLVHGTDTTTVYFTNINSKKLSFKYVGEFPTTEENIPFVLDLVTTYRHDLIMNNVVVDGYELTDIGALPIRTLRGVINDNN